MYPQRELNRLATYKTALQRDIAIHRTQCTKAASRMAQPFALLDRFVAIWRRLSPFALFATIPLGFLAQRTVFHRLKVLRPLVRWGPLIFNAARSISSLVFRR